MTTRQAIQAALDNMSTANHSGFVSADKVDWIIYESETSPSAMRKLFAEFDAEIAAAAERERVLREALANLVQINEAHNLAVEHAIGRPVEWKDSYLDAARAALKGSQP